MNDIQYKLEVEKTNLLSGLLSLLVAMAGIALLLWSNNSAYWVGREAFQGLVKDLGSLTVVSVAIAFVWELIAKRAFVNELLTKARISQALSASGIVQIVYEPYSVNWDELFANTRKVDAFFAYGKNWRGTHEVRLNRIASAKGNVIRIILPDPDNEAVVKDLAKRVNKSESGMRDRILDAKRDFSQMKAKNANSGANIEIWYAAVTPTFTLYLFDMAVVISLYSYLRDKRGVPHFVAVKGGTLYDSLSQEFKVLLDTDSGLSRRVE